MISKMKLIKSFKYWNRDLRLNNQSYRVLNRSLELESQDTYFLWELIFTCSKQPFIW